MYHLHLVLHNLFIPVLISVWFCYIFTCVTIYPLQYAYLPKLSLPKLPVDKRLQIEEMGKSKWGRKKNNNKKKSNLQYSCSPHGARGNLHVPWMETSQREALSELQILFIITNNIFFFPPS